MQCPGLEITYTVQLEDASFNVINILNSSCTSEMQCTEEIIVPQERVYDKYFIEIIASNNDLGTSSSNQTDAIGQFLIYFNDERNCIVTRGVFYGMEFIYLLCLHV